MICMVSKDSGETYEFRDKAWIKMKLYHAMDRN